MSQASIIRCDTCGQTANHYAPGSIRISGTIDLGNTMISSYRSLSANITITSGTKTIKTTANGDLDFCNKECLLKAFD